MEKISRNFLRNSAAPLAVLSGVFATSRPEKLLADMNTEILSFKDRHFEEVASLKADIRELKTSVDDEFAAIGRKQIASGLGGSSVSGGAISGARSMSPDLSSGLLAAMRGQPNAAFEKGTGSAGGFTVIPEIDQLIMPYLRQASPLRNWATHVEQDVGSGDWEKIITVTGGKSAWVGETDVRGETDTQVLGKVTVPAHEIMALPETTNHLLDDSAFDVEAMFRDDVYSEFALQEGLAFTSGTGVKQPTGILNGALTQEADGIRAFGTFEYLASGDANTIVADNLFDLKAKLRSVFLVGDGVGWLMNSSTLSVLRKLKTVDGDYIIRPGLETGDPDSLLGYPIGIDESMPDVAAGAFPIGFGNWKRAYAIVDKLGMKMLRDNLTKKGWTKFYFYRRVGGAPLDTNAAKFLKIEV